MKKAIIIFIAISGVLLIFAGAHKETQTEAYEETIQKEIKEIDASVEHNNITLTFSDDTYIQTDMNKIFFTKTNQKESIVKKYDENENLTYVHVFYNPDTTEIY